MLYCRYCNYLVTKACQNELTDIEDFICELSKSTLPENFEELNIDYPCCRT